MSLIREAINLMAPNTCDVCGDYADADGNLSIITGIYSRIYGPGKRFHICSSCMAGFVPQPPDKRWFTVLSNPVENDPYPDMTLFMPFAYSGVVDRALPAIKFRGRKEMARLLGILLGRIILGEEIGCDIIVPMPLGRERFCERGFNQALEMSYPISVITGVPLSDDVLLRRIDTARQSGITDSVQRAVNVSGAFEVNSKWDLSGLRVMLTDDVATTGHTMHEAAMTLIGAGADDVLCCAFSGNRQLKNDEPF